MANGRWTAGESPFSSFIFHFTISLCDIADLYFRSTGFKRVLILQNDVLIITK